MGPADDRRPRVGGCAEAVVLLALVVVVVVVVVVARRLRDRRAAVGDAHIQVLE